MSRDPTSTDDGSIIYQTLSETSIDVQIKIIKGDILHFACWRSVDSDMIENLINIVETEPTKYLRDDSNRLKIVQFLRDWIERFNRLAVKQKTAAADIGEFRSRSFRIVVG